MSELAAALAAAPPLVPKPENLGRCYELSGIRVGMSAKPRRLVHGTIQGMDNPPIGHGWVIEPDGQVWEPATGQVWDAAVFEALFNPTVHVTYTPSEARRKMVDHGHYGPWEDQ